MFLLVDELQEAGFTLRRGVSDVLLPLLSNEAASRSSDTKIVCEYNYDTDELQIPSEVAIALDAK